MAAPTKLDWKALKKEYVTDPTLSYADLAKKYGTSKNTVERHASKDKWVKSRQTVGEKAEAKAMEKAVDQLSEINIRHTSTYKAMQNLLAKNLTALIEYTDSVTRRAKAANRAPTPAELNTMSQLNFLTQAFRTALDGERITVGLPTTVTQNKTDMNITVDFSQYDDEVLDAILDGNPPADKTE